MNDKQGIKGAQSQTINNAFEKAKDPLTLDYLASTNGFPNASMAGYCARCASAKPGQVEALTNQIQQVVAEATKTQKIKRSCIEASLQRDVGNTGYTCNGTKKEAFENSGASAPCLNQKVVNFLQFALNKAINCMSTGRDPIDSRFILKKINNETAFNFFVAYSGGVGIGQLTSDPVKEIAGWKKGKTLHEGNAKHILEGVLNSSNPSCAPFAEILKNEDETAPPLPGSPKNYCTWVSPGEGLARNLIYALGYYVYMRDDVIRPAMEKRSPVMAKNNDLLNYFTLVAYGPGGPAQSLAMLRNFRLSDKSNPEDVKTKILKNSGYVNQTEEKMLELLGHLKEEPYSNHDKKGNTCVE
ncbi:MAG: hypothetical protein OM95_11590 [Bdellovibrio sp. ArHS]|nr:MAG: hypothetical protein OM95_11590 [Bdellovibrio sp. ArHS]